MDDLLDRVRWHFGMPALAESAPLAAFDSLALAELLALTEDELDITLDEGVFLVSSTVGDVLSSALAAIASGG